MNQYEILLMLDPELPEERQSQIVQRMREALERAGGTWVGHDAWGRRRLAYEIDRKPEGTYHLVSFDSDPATLDELSRVLRITDGVMRHMPTRRVARPSRPPREPEAAAADEAQQPAGEPEPETEPAESAVGTPE